MANIVGDLTTGPVTWDSRELGAYINTLIQGVSERELVLMKDIKFRCYEATAAEGGVMTEVYVDEEGTTENRMVYIPATVEEAADVQTPLFDCYAYLTMGANQRPHPYLAVRNHAGAAQWLLAARQSLCWMAIYIMIRGDYYTSDNTQTGRDIPAFLINTFGMDGTPQELRARLSSFPIQKVPHDWVRYLKWSSLSQKVRQRLGLQLAGYRSLAALTYYEPSDRCHALVRINIQWVRAVSRLPRDWSVVSATRGGELVQLMGSINAGVAALLHLGYTRAQRDQMVANKSLYNVGVYNPRDRNWRSWYKIPLERFNDPVNLDWEWDGDGEEEPIESPAQEEARAATVQKWDDYLTAFLADHGDLDEAEIENPEAPGGGGGGHLLG